MVILKEIKNPLNEDGDFITGPGDRTGILVNGVEILNYKSDESVYYGNIKNIDIASEGIGNDVINHQVLNISDNSNYRCINLSAIPKCTCMIEENRKYLHVQTFLVIENYFRTFF